MSEDLRSLIAAARKVVSNCERYLEAAVELVHGIPARRERVLERIAAAEDLAKQAEEEFRRVVQDDSASRAQEKEAEIAYSRASNRAYRARQELGSDDLDPENRKAVARQLAGLIREDSEQRLNAIAARSDDLELQRTVTECKEEVVRATRYVQQRFAEAIPLQHDEVRKARAEASELLDSLRNPPVSR